MLRILLRGWWGRELSLGYARFVGMKGDIGVIGARSGRGIVALCAGACIMIQSAVKYNFGWIEI